MAFLDATAVRRQSSGGPNIGAIVKVAVFFVILIVSLVAVSEMVVSVDQNDIMVVQSLGGTLTWYTNGGYHCQCWGKVTKYHKRSQFWFSNRADQGKDKDESIIVRFNDGGHANLSGSVAWEMPLDAEHLNQLHMKYGSQEAVEQQLIRTVVEKSVYMTGPLMSSAESYAEKRNDLIQLIEDQISNGILKTQTIEMKQPDPITGEQKTVSVVKLVLNEKNLPVRQEESPLKTFGLKTYNLSLNNVKYDDRVEAQIQQQQQAKMQVQTAIANAKKAEQDAITAQKNGEAEVAKAKWEQEVIKAKAVTKAQQELAVAELETKAAAQYKQAQILKGEGDGAYKKAVMIANGALEQKLDAIVKINEQWANAFSRYQGDVTPKVVTGGNGAHGNSAVDFMNMMNVYATKQLALDMGMESGKGKK